MKWLASATLLALSLALLGIISADKVQKQSQRKNHRKYGRL